MSKKYYENLMASSGSTSIAFKSKFGSKIMSNLGWEKGKGLGLNEHGIVAPI